MFSIENIAIEILNYPLSWLEIFAVITGLIAVYFASQGKVINFWIGLANSILYTIFFYQIRLYSAMFLQVGYFIINLYGIFAWRKPTNESDKRLEIRNLSIKRRLVVATVILLLGAIWGSVIVWGSSLYPQWIAPAQYPYIDATLAMASIVAQVMLTRKLIENWMIWVIVDIISTIFYLYIGIYFTSILYGVLTIIAYGAYRVWRKEIITTTQQ